MLDQHTIAVIGLGLVGGSVARDCAARGARVLGGDTDDASLEAALASGVVHEPLDPDLAALRDATVVVVAVPVSVTPTVIDLLATRVDPGALIIDVGSTKRGAIAAAERAGIAPQFVGCHPMAGDSRGGWPASRTDLFAGATVYLCPTAATRRGHLELARELWQALGGRCSMLDAAEHDRLVAFTSHLPHAASAALALSLSASGIDVDALGPGGRDVLRIAGSGAEMWSAIATENADALLDALRAFRGQLARFETAVAARDETSLRALFADARGWTMGGDQHAAPRAAGAQSLHERGVARGPYV